MGNTISPEEVQRRFDGFKQKLPTPTDLTVDRNFQMLTGRTCSDSLKLHLERRTEEFPSKAPDIVKALVDKIASLLPSPEVAGLGALAIAIFIDVLSDISPGQSTKDALHEALAEQKVLEVWDLVDETLKRCEMHLKNKRQLASDLQRLEAELSVALTRLKNSVLRDGHFSSQALKIWVNGAAFHLQMLIHQHRLQGATSCQPVERLIPIYKNDLEKLFMKHQEMIKSKCRLYKKRTHERTGAHDRYLENEARQRIRICHDIKFSEYLQVYHQHQYGRQEEEIQCYFSEIQHDLQQLLSLKGHLRLNPVGTDTSCTLS